MALYGDTTKTDQAGPREPVARAAGPERAFLDPCVVSGPTCPRPGSQGDRAGQVGGDPQEPFLGRSQAELLPALREP
ncbi:hypothetical protein ACFY8C_33955 [Streptomyces flavochromogenes]|uniref:Uncharacterized protein n=1 Tax=Streptomyces flavochromogenes TaxID=68199 RepID=A0ABW6Y0I2_9ACTN|nr:hypothetical protein [Streptomyces flavochromogenes]